MALAASWAAGPRGEEPGPSSENLDWDLLLRLAWRHRISGLVHAGLNGAGVRPPSPAADVLQAEARRIAIDELRTAGEALRLQEVLRSGGVEPMILKGVAVAMLAYGRLGLRYNFDIDILVHPKDVASSLRLLGEQGYRYLDGEDADGPTARWLELHKDIALRHASGRSVVELHWRLFNNPRLLGGAHPEGRPVRLTANGVVQTLPEHLNLIFLCVHGAEHAWERLKWLVDVHALVMRMSDDSLAALYESAREKNVHRAVAQALLLCSRLFGLPIPDAIARSRRSLRIRLLEALALHSMLASGDREVREIRFGSTLKNVSHYLLSDGWGYWRAELDYDVADVSRAPPPRYLRRLGLLGRLIGWAGHHLRLRRRPS